MENYYAPNAKLTGSRSEGDKKRSFFAFRLSAWLCNIPASLNKGKFATDKNIVTPANLLVL